MSYFLFLLAWRGYIPTYINILRFDTEVDCFHPTHSMLVIPNQTAVCPSKKPSPKNTISTSPHPPGRFKPPRFYDRRKLDGLKRCFFPPQVWNPHQHWCLKGGHRFFLPWNATKKRLGEKNTISVVTSRRLLDFLTFFFWGKQFGSPPKKCGQRKPPTPSVIKLRLVSGGAWRWGMGWALLKWLQRWGSEASEKRWVSLLDK